ncbi:MAG: hypothetical protein M1827_000930 [Pycnora praestabilis]|nr:MAG: hypothetical protein M1827_000930 [Pycnora praestabilis]
MSLSKANMSYLRVRNLTLKRNLSTNVSARHKTQKPPSQANFSTTTRSVEDPPSQQETLSTHVRTLMRSIPHCVVVVTASHSSPLSPSKSPSSSHTRSIKASSPIPTEDFRGMTVSSFNTVTLSPQPIISFNIHLPSTTYDALLSSRQFLVHIVSATKDGAKIADAFTRGNANAEEVFRNLANEGVDVGVLGRGKRRPPVLRGRGVMKVLSCDMLIEKGVPSDGVRVGDHVIVLGKVVGVLVDSGRRGKREGGGSSMEERGLLYVDRGYKEFGRGITIDSGRES